MSDKPPIPDGIGASTAPQLFGFLFNWMLMGALTVQVYHYHNAFPKDPSLTKAIVYTVFFLELAQTILMGYSSYKIFGSGYGDLRAFNDNQVDWFSVCVLGSIIPGMVQMFYAHRLYRLSSSKIMAGIIAFLAMLQTISGIVQGILSKLAQVNSALTSKPIVLTLWTVSAVICDILIATFMTYYLKMRQASTLSARMKDAVERIVRYTVETGAVTAVISIIFLILFLATPNNDYYAAPSRGLAKLYSNNLLVLLNARAIIIGGRSGTASGEYVNEIRLNTAGNVSADQIRLNTTSHEMTKISHSAGDTHNLKGWGSHTDGTAGNESGV